MKKLLFAFVLVCTCWIVPAQASILSHYDTPYISFRYLNVFAKPTTCLETELNYGQKTLSWSYLPSFSVAGGYSFGYNPMRVELELSGFTMFSNLENIDFDTTNTTPDVHSFDAKNFILGSSVNVYFDHAFTDIFSVYTGGGIGAAIPFLHIASETSSLKLFKPAKPRYQWNLTIGASVELEKNLFFDMGYRFVNIPSGLPSAVFTVDSKGKPTLDIGDNSKKFKMSQIVLGMRYSF